MRKIISSILLVVFLMSFAYVIPISANTPALVYYVSPSGSDTNNGTISDPFQTIARARDAATTAIGGGSLSEGSIIIYFREGVYTLTNTVSFTSEHSGTADNPIIFKAYNGEKVTFSFATSIDTVNAVKVNDPIILNRVIDPMARKKLMKIDLSSYVSNIPAIPDYGFAFLGSYYPVEIYIGNEALTKARWPNVGEEYLRIASVQSPQGYNFKTDPFVITYSDSTNRASLWSEAALADLYVGGYIGYDWADSNNKVASLDAVEQKITSVGGTPYCPAVNQRLFFYNLLEEIDTPGESYIDRINKIVYFYPPNNLSDINIVSIDKKMFELTDVKYITFKNLKFKYARRTLMTISGEHNVIDGCTFAHTAEQAVYMTGRNSRIKNCHVYDTGRKGVSIIGGNSKSLEYGQLVAQNNRIHNVSRVYKTYQPALTVSGAGNVARNNELYNSPHYIFGMNGNNNTAEYNEIHHAVTDSSDMGAMYMGRTVANLGQVCRFNYFHNIGNKDSGEYGQNSIFFDDGYSGQTVYGNIFYRGTLTSEYGGTVSAVKTNGGQYNLVRNNIFVDAPISASFQGWNGGLSGGKQGRWWLYVYDKWSGGSGSLYQKMIDVDFDSRDWRQHYYGTQGAYLNQLFAVDFYDNYLATLDPVNDKTALLAYANQYAPSYTNTFSSNISIKVDVNPGGEAFTGNGTGNNNFRAANHILPSGNSMFVDYGKNFKLTVEGMNFIRQTIPDFENIPTEFIGLYSYGSHNEKYPGGTSPVASLPEVVGDIFVNGIAEAQYTFTDLDGDNEGQSKLQWYSSDTESGEYTKLSGKMGKELLIDETLGCKYIKFMVIPYDENMISGEAVMSEPVFVNYVNENFENDMLGTIPMAWTLKNSTKGTISVISENGNQFLRLNAPMGTTTSNSATNVPVFVKEIYDAGVPLSSNFNTVIEAKVRTNSQNFRKYLKLNYPQDSSAPGYNDYYNNFYGIWFFHSDNKYYTLNGQSSTQSGGLYLPNFTAVITSYNNDIWYTVKTIIRTADQEVDTYISDGTTTTQLTTSSNIWYMNDMTSIKNLTFFFRNAVTLGEEEYMDVDDIIIYSTVD